MMWCEKGEASKIYTAKSFFNHILTLSEKIDSIWKHVWANLTLFRVEIFIWQLMHGKVVVKDKLAKKGMLQNNSILCMLRNVERETCCYLFITYCET